MEGVARRVAVERHVARAAEEAGGLDEERGLPRDERAEAPHERLVRDALRPLDPERLRGELQALQAVGLGRGHRAQDPDVPAEHQLRGGHPGQQGDLRIPALDGQRRAEPQAVALLVVRDQLLREREAHAASTRLALLPEDADLAEKAQLLGRAPFVERLLGTDVVELRAAADERAVDVHRRAFAGLVDVHRPHERRTNLLGQEARGALREHGRVEAHVDVRGVEGRAALVRLDVHRPARLDERGHVRDRVLHAIAVAATFEVEGLVEIHRRGRVERHERGRRLVCLRKARRGRCLLRLGEHVWRELGRDLSWRRSSANAAWISGLSAVRR